MASRAGFDLNRLTSKIWLIGLGEAVGIVLAVAFWRVAPEISKILVGAAATLFFGALLGGVVKLLFDDLDRDRLARAAQIDFVSRVLSDLKDVYDLVDSGRTLLIAHKSAKTYGEQMRGFIGARVKLRNVVRALKFDERGKSIGNVATHAERMERYLRTLTNEFEASYKDVSRAQSVYEKGMAAAANAIALPANTPWDVISDLLAVKGFIAPLQDDPFNPADSKGPYECEFVDPLDAASDDLRQALRRELDPSRAALPPT